MLIKTRHLHWNIWFPIALVLLFVAAVHLAEKIGDTSTAPTCKQVASGDACPSSVVGNDNTVAPLPVDAQVAHPDRLAEEVEKLDSLAPGTAWQRRVDKLTLASQDRLFASRFHGPYSVSVLDKLNEMVIGTNLQAYGVSSTDAPLRLGNPVLSAIPSSMPTYGYISSNFGMRRSPFTGRRVQHNGLDIAVNYGSPVYATADGIVTLAGNRSAMGRMVTINHGFGILTRYGHNSQVIVKAGDYVQKGQRIALSGSTGRSTGAHLHYEVWVNGEVVDPTKFMFDVPPSAMSPADELVTHNEMPAKFNLGFAVGGDSGEFVVGQDLVAAAMGERKAQTVLTLMILALFAVACAALVVVSGRNSNRDYSLPIA